MLSAAIIASRQVAGMSDKPRLATETIAGLRPYQEDSVLTQTLPDGRTLVAVADGMGGHAAGEVASALALEVLVETVTGGTPLGEAFALANQRVHTKSREPGKAGMGTTLVAMLLDGDSFEVANVGDSRAYLISGDGIRQITEDHSLLNDYLKVHKLTQEEIENFPHKNVIVRALGMKDSVMVDIHRLAPRPGDVYLLCSDGLNGIHNGGGWCNEFIGDWKTPSIYIRSQIKKPAERIVFLDMGQRVGCSWNLINNMNTMTNGCWYSSPPMRHNNGATFSFAAS